MSDRRDLIAANYTVEQLKGLGFSNADIEYILEMSAVYVNTLNEGPISEFKIQSAKVAFQAGVIVGLSRVRKVKKLTKIGF